MRDSVPRLDGVPSEEQARLAALHGYRVLDTAPDPRFDRLTRLAAGVLRVPIAIITLVDEHRQWFKSKVGLDVPETARDIAICSQTIQSRGVTLIRDAQVDPRYRDNPLVTSGPAIRFYAGVSLETAEGHRIGTFAVADRSPRDLSQTEIHILEDFALLAMDALELWRYIVKADEQQAQRLARAEQRVQEAQRLEALGRLAGGIAHDLNNLLTVILGNASFARDAVSEGATVVHELAQIDAAGERAAMLTRQVLAFARRQVLSTGPVDLNALVAGMLPLLIRLVGEHIRVNFEPDSAAGSIRADASQLEQVLMNLFANARDALSDGGEIRIRTQQLMLDEGAVRTHADVAPGRFIAVTVEDNGQGMPPETVERAFDPFFTTKQLGHGTGLGLSIVHGIIRQHGGFIELDSEPGRGTVVRIFLPQSDERPAPAASQLREVNAEGTETVLLAEDNDLVREVAVRILRRAGYEVLEAHDGAEAVAMYEEAPERVALVILDLLMPRLGGMAALRKMQARHAEIRYLFASGYVEDSALPAEHVRHLIPKPYDRATLLRRVREALDA